MMNWRASHHQGTHIYFYLKGSWDGGWWVRGEGIPGSVSQLSSFFHFVQALAFDGYGNEASNECDVRPRWEKWSADPRREAAAGTERPLQLSANCSFNAPPVFEVWVQSRLEGQILSAELIPNQSCLPFIVCFLDFFSPAKIKYIIIHKSSFNI